MTCKKDFLSNTRPSRAQNPQREWRTPPGTWWPPSRCSPPASRRCGAPRARCPSSASSACCSASCPSSVRALPPSLPRAPARTLHARANRSDEEPNRKSWHETAQVCGIGRMPQACVVPYTWPFLAQNRTLVLGAHERTVVSKQGARLPGLPILTTFRDSFLAPKAPRRRTLCTRPARCASTRAARHARPSRAALQTGPRRSSQALARSPSYQTHGGAREPCAPCATRVAATPESRLARSIEPT